MNLDNTIDKIIYLPKEFSKKGDTSIYDLLKKSGYFEKFNQISEDKILKAVKENPLCINDWLLWSENKRSDSGWYFKKYSDNKYAVGNLISGKGNIQEIEYSDASVACAAFIKKEIEDIRTA